MPPARRCERRAPAAARVDLTAPTGRCLLISCRLSPVTNSPAHAGGAGVCRRFGQGIGANRRVIAIRPDRPSRSGAIIAG
jgi:hypothetical protein